MTAMCTPCGTVQWTVLPMGLKNAPSMFWKMMETIFFQKHKSLDLQEFCSIYIDDLLIATPLGKNFDECLKLHEEQVRKVLEVLRHEKLVRKVYSVFSTVFLLLLLLVVAVGCPAAGFG